MNEVLVLCYVCIFEAVVRQQKLACPRGMNQSGFFDSINSDLSLQTFISF